MNTTLMNNTLMNNTLMNNTFDTLMKWSLEKDAVEKRADAISSLRDASSFAPDPSVLMDLKVALTDIGDGCVEGHVFEDVEMFETYTNIPSRSNVNTLATVSDVFTREASLAGGRAVLLDLLRNPTCDRKTLETRQRNLRSLASSRLLPTFKSSLRAMSDMESDVNWAFHAPDEEAETLRDMLFFNSYFLRKLNGSPASLTAYALMRIIVSPLLGVLTPLMYVIVPYLVLRYHGIRLTLAAYVKMLYLSFSLAGSMMSSGAGTSGAWIKYASVAMTVLFYFQSLFTSFEVSRTLTTVCTIICEKMKNVHAFLRLASDMRKAALEDGLDFERDWLHVDTTRRGAMELHTLSPNDEFRGEVLHDFSIFRNFGRSLAAYKAFDAAGNAHFVKYAYLLDAIVAVEGARTSKQLCYTAFTDAKKFEAASIFHPCLSPNTAVKNSVDLATNMILTGPNAGGKSTLLKSILIAAILSQSVTLAPCASLVQTPFKLVRSQINVPDCKGSQSLFEAEMFRCKDSLDKLRLLDKTREHSLIVMDEIFSSTNVVEGISGAYAVAKALGSMEHNVTVISTHFAYLCKLAKSGLYSNHKMQVSVDEKKDICRPYVLSPGISKQYVALELLKKNGFDASLIDDALDVRRRLTERRPAMPIDTSQTKETQESRMSSMSRVSLADPSQTQESHVAPSERVDTSETSKTLDTSETSKTLDTSETLESRVPE